MGFFSDLGQGFSNVVGGVLNPVANILGTAIQGATGLINSPGGANALGALGGIIGGPAGIALAGLGQGAQNTQRQGKGWTIPITNHPWQFYELMPNGLYQRGADGGRIFQWGKFLGFVVAPLVFIVVFGKKIMRWVR